MGKCTISTGCDPDWNALVCIAYSWQTLIAGLLALAAAGLTIFYMHCQIRAEDRRHREDRESKAWGARARLPDALSAICVYTEKCTAYCLSPTTNDRPDDPVAALNDIKSAIEFVDPGSAEKLFGLVVQYQIQHSRLDGRVNHLKEDLLYDAALLRALTNQLFEYARNKVETALKEKVDRDEMTTALRTNVGLTQAHQLDAELKPVYRLIEIRHSE